MRAIVVRPGPHFSVADVCRGWVKGLRDCGVEVLDFNFDERLDFYCAHPTVEGKEAAATMAAKGIEVAAFEGQPELVVVVSGFFVPPFTYEILRARGIKTILVHTESPYEDGIQALRAQRADLNIVNDPTNISDFPAGTLYLPHCYDPDSHRPQKVANRYRSDFCFVGTGFPSRVEFFSAVDWTDIDVTLAGNWRECQDSPLAEYVAHDFDECLDNDEAVKLYNGSKASANLYRKETHKVGTADGWAMGPREVELAACGLFFLREPRPEGDELFPMLPTFTDPHDFEDKLRWWLAHDSERDAAAHKAREAVADRTFDRNAARALTALGF